MILQMQPFMMYEYSCMIYYMANPSAFKNEETEFFFYPFQPAMGVSTLFLQKKWLELSQEMCVSTVGEGQESRSTQPRPVPCP
jgi:hypothetical protein